MFFRSIPLILAGCLLGTLCLPGPRALAQAPPASLEQQPRAPELSADDLQKSLARLEENKELDEAAKAPLRELYQRSLQELQAIAESDAALAQYEQQIRDAPQAIAQARQDRSAVTKAPSLSLPENAKLDQLEKELAQIEESVAERKQRLARLTAEPARRDARRAELPRQLNEARTELEQRQTELAGLPPAAEPSPSMLARQTFLRLRTTSLRKSIAALERERAAYDATDELLQIQHDIAAAGLATATQRSQQLRELVNRVRKAEADRQLQRARRAAARALPQLAKLAKNATELATERRQLADDLATASEQLEQVRATLAEVDRQFARTKSKVKAGRLSQAVGQVLRQERARLPHVQEHRRNIHVREPLRTNLEFVRYKHQDRRGELSNFQQEVDRLRRQLQIEANADIESEIRDLLETERDYLDQLISDYNAYSHLLLELDVAEEDLIDTIADYASFIDERVFWIRSGPAISHHDIQPGMHAGRWLLSTENWRTLFYEMAEDVRHNPAWLVTLLLASGPLFFFQRRIRRQIGEMGNEAARGSFARYLATFRVLLLTLYIAVPWTAISLLGGWRLLQSYSGTEFVTAVGYGLVVTAGVYFPLELMRQVARPMGLAEAHFGWSTSVVRSVRANLKPLILAALPLVFVAVVTESQTTEPLWANSLGRAAFLITMLLATWLLHRLFRPGGRVMQELLAYRQGGWLERLQNFWYLLAIAGPLTLGVMAMFGYYYTAHELALRLLAMVYFLLGLLMLRGMLVRWILITRRKFAIKQMQERRAAQAEMPALGEGQGASLPAVEEPQTDLAAITSQSRQLIDAVLIVTAMVGAWLIWKDVLPALFILNTIPVWPGATELTMAELALALLVAGVTGVAAKNLPGLLELSVLKYLPLDAGARYASSTLARYCIICIGIITASTILTVDWTKVQWLLAALGVGLGFGLQEIFANFVCGLILLFERPIRVGDIITLDDVTGTVTRIRMRATTITNWDRKELVVPNKDLITGRLLNWTLSNQLNRITIHVGVAYGSDTERARQLLLDVATQHPRVLNDPAPSASFEAFGDSTLDLVLRCFLPDLENRISTIHELHTRIDQEFHAAGIEIAFPQRDLHVRSLPEPLRGKVSDVPSEVSASANGEHV